MWDVWCPTGRRALVTSPIYPRPALVSTPRPAGKLTPLCRKNRFASGHLLEESQPRQQLALARATLLRNLLQLSFDFRRFSLKPVAKQSDPLRGFPVQGIILVPAQPRYRIAEKCAVCVELREVVIENDEPPADELVLTQRKPLRFLHIPIVARKLSVVGVKPKHAKLGVL